VPAPSEKLLQDARALYDVIKKRDFLPFPAEFALAAQEQGVRQEIDSFFKETLGIPGEMKPIYEMLKAEPMLG
jgi:hypothetical protein